VVNRQIVVVQSRPKVKHGLHLVLTVLTGGLWLPVWIIVTVVTPK
jgi:hypothetical protein